MPRLGSAILAASQFILASVLRFSAFVKPITNFNQITAGMRCGPE